MPDWITWVALDLLFALLPIGAAIILIYLVGAKDSFSSIFRDGQLFFLCTTLAASGLGALLRKSYDLLNAHKATQLGIGISAIGLIFACCFTAILFGIVIAAKEHVIDKRVALTSMFSTVATVALVMSVRCWYNLF
jgi:hypothetical protein